MAVRTFLKPALPLLTLLPGLCLIPVVAILIRDSHGGGLPLLIQFAQAAVEVGLRRKDPAHSKGKATFEILELIVPHEQQLIVDHTGIGGDTSVLPCEFAAVIEERRIQDVYCGRSAYFAKKVLRLNSQMQRAALDSNAVIRSCLDPSCPFESAGPTDV